MPADRRFPFMDPLVLAIRAGEKDVTRRLVSNPNGWHLDTPVFGEYGGRLDCYYKSPPHYRAEQSVYSPYRPGDTLAVCEALVPRQGPAAWNPRFVSYRSDGSDARPPDGDLVLWGWKVRVLPARYCPTWAIRTRRRILSVRPQRLSWVTDDDARREGIVRLGWEPTAAAFVAGFRAMHKLDNDADPWIWRVEFGKEDVTDAR